MEEWKAGIISSLISEQERYYSETLKNDPKFSLVSRDKIDKLLNEHKCQNFDLTSTSVECGQLIGATHLLIINLSRFTSDKSPKKYEDVETHTLIEVKSGRTIASHIYRRLGT
jgi:hypothetical protein